MATTKKKSNVLKGQDPETAINMKYCENAKKQQSAGKKTPSKGKK